MFIFKLKSIATKPLLDSKMYKGVNPNSPVATSIPPSFKEIFKRDCELLFKKMNIPLVKELGSGWYSTTYESMFAGKRVCVKITTEPTEAESYLKMKDVLPSFFPRIFTVKEIGPEQLKGLSQEYYVMITELLVPLSPVVYQNLFDPLESSISLNKLTLEKVTEFIKTHIDITLGEIKKIINDNFDAFCSRFLKFLKNKDFENKIAIRDFADEMLSLSTKEIASEDRDYLRASIRNTITSLVADFKKDLYPEVDTNLPVVEEKQQLFDAIRSVESKFGITVHDLHRDNLMMRPNGELVFCDLGSYL